MSHLVLAGEAGGALLVIVSRLGLSALAAWAVLSPILYPFLRVPSDHPIVTFDRVWVLACISLVVLNRRRLATTRPMRLLLFTFAWLAIAYGERAATTSAPNLGYEAKLVWLDAVVLPIVLFLAAAKLVSSSAHALRVAAALMTGGVVLALIGIAEKVAGFELASYSRGSVRLDEGLGITRISGPYPAPEPYALTLLIAMAATLYWLQARRPRAYLVGAAALGLQMVAVGLTFFRTAWITAALVLIVALMRPGRHARSVLIVVYVAALTGLAFTQLEQDRQFSARVKNTQNVDARLATYEQAISIFERRPLTGVGVDQYTTVASTLPVTTVHGVASVPYPHDSYLGVLAETGLLGVAPFVAATGAVWFALRRFKRRLRHGADAVLATCVTAAGIAYLLMSLPLDMFTYGPPNAVLALLLGAACGRYAAVVGSDRRGGEAAVSR
jgi:O-antigen ligase